MKKSSRTIAAFALVLALASTASACGIGKSVTTSVGSAMTTSADLGDYYNEAFAMDDGAYYTTETVSETAPAASENGWDFDSDEVSYESGLSAAGGMPEPAEEAGGATGSQGGTSGSQGGADGSQDSAATAKAARKLIRTVDLNVETTEFDSLLTSIHQFVDASGGYIEQSDLSGNSISGGKGRRYASITARIPASQVDAFLSQMNEKSNVTYRSENVQDVTLKYTDIESRKKSLTIEQERLWELLEKADSLDAVIALEERLSEIRYQLEKFESQLRTYDNQVDYSTVYISINEVAVFTPTQPDSVMTRIQKGFTRNLKGVGDGFIDFFVWFVSSLPTLVVWAVLIAVAVLIVRPIVKHFRKKNGKSLAKPNLQPKAEPQAENRPMTKTENVPVTRQENVPVAQAENVPVAQAENAPVAQAENVPVARTENKGEQGMK